MPTPIASTSARTRCAWRFAAADVSGVRRPGASAMRPSRLVAALRMTNGRPLAHQREERLVQRDRASRRRQPDLDRDAVRAQEREAAAAHERIRILDRRDDARDAGVDDPADARAGAALVAARLERAVQRRAARARAGRRRARAPRRAARRRAREIPARRRRRRPTRRRRRPADSGWCARGRARRETARAPCIRSSTSRLRCHHFSSNRPSTYSSAENGTRSSMPSPTPT